MKFAIKPLIGTYALMIAIVFILPFFSAEGYSIVRHTTSQLGAQKTPNSWIMNTVFILLGSSTILAGWKHYANFWIQKILLVIFGVSLVFTGIFQHAPITLGVNFNVHADQLHSVFATTTGFSFTLLAFATAFVKEQKSTMVLPFTMGLLATLLSLCMFQFDSFMGIWQRLLFITSFGWMIYEFND